MELKMERQDQPQYLALQSDNIFLESDIETAQRIQIPTAYLPIEIKPNDRLLLDNCSSVTWYKAKAVSIQKQKVKNVPTVYEKLVSGILLKRNKWVIVEIEKIGRSFGGLGLEVGRPTGLIDSQERIISLEHRIA